jgi:centromeric protein E
VELTQTKQLQQELLSARREIESQSTQILSLEAALLARPELPPDAPESEKDRLLGEQARNIRELEMVVKGYEDNLGAPLRAVREDVEREWSGRLEAEEAKRKEAEEWAAELARALEKEKKVRAHHVFFARLIRLMMVLVIRHGSSWKANVVPSRRS